MKTTTLLSAALVAALSLAGCGEEGPVEGPYRPPEGRESQAGDVSLHVLARPIGNRFEWYQELPHSPRLYYHLHWQPLSPTSFEEGDTGTQFIHYIDGEEGLLTGSRRYTAEIGPIRPQLYQFTLDVMTNGQSTPVTSRTIVAAPAERHYYDAADPSRPLRLYEEGSEVGRSGLILDPAEGGPRAVRMVDAQPGTVDLALVERNSTLVLQIASTTEEWGGSGRADDDVVTLPDESDVARDLGYWAPLDDWWSFRPGPLDASSWTASGRYHFVEYGSRGLYRIGDGASGSWRFVRLSPVPVSEGVYIRGEAPNRYVELELSIGHPGIPFA